MQPVLDMDSGPHYRIRADKGVLILSGYNIRAVVAFCRWACKRQLSFHIIARNEQDPIFRTTFRNRVFAVREREHLELEEFCGWISGIREQYSYENVLILPSSEFLNRFLINNRASIYSVGGIVPLAAKELYECISDKYSFGEKCLEFSIPVPEEYQTMPMELPFVAKPRTYASINKRQLKPYLICNAEDLKHFRRNEAEGDYYFQRYIEGESFYLLASLPRKGEPVLFSQENLVQQAGGGSIILARISEFHKMPIAGLYVRLLEEVGFHGLIMIEVRFQKDTQEYFMIEANPRLWGPIQLVVDNGVDILGSFLRDYEFEVNSPSNSSEQAPYYFWSGGMVEDAKPFSFHNYSPGQFVNEFNYVMSHDLFLREDTIDLFRAELAALCGFPITGAS